MDITPKGFLDKRVTPTITFQLAQSHVKATPGQTLTLRVEAESSQTRSWAVRVGGVPTAWVRYTPTKGQQVTLDLKLSLPAHLQPALYPLSITLFDRDALNVTITRPLTLEVAPLLYVSKTPAARPPGMVRGVVTGMMATFFLAVCAALLWLNLRPGAESGTAVAAPVLAGLVQVVPPALMPEVAIAPQWRPPLPTALPPTLTPVLSPTPLPLQTVIVGEAASGDLAPLPIPTLAPTGAGQSPIVPLVAAELSPLPPTATPDAAALAAMAPVAPPAPARYAATGYYVSGMTYEQMFQDVAAQYNLDWRLLASIAYRESRLYPAAVGRSGEMGMMQIMPATWDNIAPKVGATNPFHPYDSTLVAAYFLSYLQNYTYSLGHSETYWTVVGYNWGPNNLRNHWNGGGDWGGLPLIRQNYAYSVIDTMNQPDLQLWTYDVKQLVPVPN